MQRELIGSVQLNRTTTGKNVADLYSTDTRLQFPVLRLFDLSALTLVGLDPAAMGKGRVHKRFWAYYTESGKMNSEGNPYRDVHHLEPIEPLPMAVDGSELLDELVAPDLLVLDDLGAEATKGWINDKIYLIINRRYELDRPIVVTTNLDLAELERKLGERTASRLWEMCDAEALFEFPDVDYRREHM